ncbi:MAG TPA: 2-C-methyl-D-erythritol 4-phosphate cytidylyltransferase [Acidimicrobiia bacterium]|nr:2-C-methyl-D-erythritol 4-phosphate cytidylyltransferase [Acidimicrobiia bacterium]
MSVWAIVVAAGAGARYGGAKQFERLGASTVLDRSVATACAACDGVVVVLAAGAAWTPPAGVACVPGGATRSDSVRAGLAAVPDDADVVVVHDAARPLASEALFRATIAAVRDGADGAVPGVAVADTVKRVERDVVVETVPRDALVAVQTPQAFSAERLRAAHASGGVDTDDAALIEALGGRVVVVPGERANIKITTADDLRVVRALGDDT